LNPGRRGGKPATNRFSYGAAIHSYLDLALENPQWSSLFFIILTRFELLTAITMNIIVSWDVM
jgi:hypothetical protein